jgi:hypothetical protein
MFSSKELKIISKMIINFKKKMNIKLKIIENLFSFEKHFIKK